MNSTKKVVLNTVFLFAVFGLTMYYIFHGQDFHQILSYVQTSDLRFWWLAVVCVILFILSESVIIYYLMRTVGQEIKLLHCFLYSFVGFFFSCITPSASGGQPAQIYFMKKDRIPIPVATLILMIVTITYKFVLVLLGVLVFVFRPASVMVFLQPVWGWCCLGIVLNVFCVTAMMVLVFHPTLATNILVLLYRILGKIIHFKNPEEKIARIRSSMQKYQDVASYLSQHKMVIFNVILISIVQRYFLFFVTYLTYRSFGLHEFRSSVLVTLQGMISVSVDMLPLPGGMGISESLFLQIFPDIFGKQLLLPAMIISRGLGYYTELLVSALVTALCYFIQQVCAFTAHSVRK